MCELSFACSAQNNLEYGNATKTKMENITKRCTLFLSYFLLTKANKILL